MKWTRLFLLIILIASFIISFSVYSLSIPNTNIVSIYILIPSSFNTSLPRANLVYLPVSNYSILSFNSGQIDTYQAEGINTLGKLINYSLKNQSAIFSNDCLIQKYKYICSNSSYAWFIFYVNSLSQTVLNVNHSTLSIPLSSLYSQNNVFVLIYSKLIPVP